MDENVAFVGGARLARGFLAAGGVNRIILTIVPRLLGDGIPLFSGFDQELELLESRTFSDCVVQITYWPATRASP